MGIGDFNGDGILDLVAGGPGVSVLLGNGDGTFASSIDSSTIGFFVSLAVADFNGDGLADVITAEVVDGVVEVLLGNGDGTFTSAPLIGLYAPFLVSSGDFNSDGKADIVVECCSDFSDFLQIFVGNGDGTFFSGGGEIIGASCNSIAVADLNRDSKADVVCGASAAITVALGNGDGTLRNSMNYSTGNLSVLGVATADFNGDNIIDVAGAVNGADVVVVLLGRGDGSFRHFSLYPTGAGPRGIATADFDRDGALDLGVSDISANTVAILLNSGGTFVTTTSSANPSTFGQPVTFTTSVVASISGVPTGTVTFKDGAITLGSATVSSGQASFTTSKLNVGIHKIRAEYSGDSTFNPHKAVPVVQKVQP